MSGIAIPNHGQYDGQTLFLGRSGGATVHFGHDTVAITMFEPGVSGEKSRGGASVHVHFEGADPRAEVVGVGLRAGMHHFLSGRDPSGWVRDVPAYSGVLYRSIYPGVDVSFSFTETGVEYDLHLAPGADPDVVQLRILGAASITLAQNGSLTIDTAHGTITQRPPVAFAYDASGRRRSIQSRLHRLDCNLFGFAVPKSNHEHIVVDPEMIYSSFFGGADGDRIHGLALLPSGDVLIVGQTNSDLDFPTTPGAFDTTSYFYPEDAAFVTRFSPSTNTLHYSTYLAGNGSYSSAAHAVDVGADEQAVVSGYTRDSGFPTTSGAFDTTHDGANDTFVSRLSADGSSLVFSTFLDGDTTSLCAWLPGPDVAVANDGSVWISGATGSPSFPATAGAAQSVYGGGDTDGFVAHLNASGTSLLAATFLGGSGSSASCFVDYETCAGVAVAEDGDIVVAGTTVSADFPTTSGVIQPIYGGGSSDGFMARFSPDLSALRFSTFLGGMGRDRIAAVHQGDGSSPTFVGSTNSADYPLSPGAYDTTLGALTATSGTACQTNQMGTHLIFSTFLGNLASYDVVLDPQQRPLVVGVSEDYRPAFARLAQDGTSADFDFTFGGFLANNTDRVEEVVLNRFGVAVLAGITYSKDFPVTADAFDTKFNGQSKLRPDGFITLFDVCDSTFDDQGGGCAGTLGLTPQLLGHGCIDFGYVVQVDVGLALGGATGFLFASMGTGSTPIGGCSFDLQTTSLVCMPITLQGAGGGAGSTRVEAKITHPLPPGEIFLQALLMDPGAANGVAITNRLRITIAP